MKKIIIPALVLGCLSTPLLGKTLVSGADHESPFYITLELGSQDNRFTEFEAQTTEPLVTGFLAVDKRDKAPYYGLGAGYSWGSLPLRTELTFKKVGSQTFADQMLFVGAAEETTVKVKQELLMLEMLYDFEINDSKIKPYAGLGLGISKTKVSAIQFDAPVLPGRYASFAEHSETNFAWSLVAGVDYKITKNIDLGLGYRYTDAGEVGTDNNCQGSDPFICDANEQHSSKLKSHALFLKTSYHF